MDKLIIRAAVKEDVPAIFALVKELAKYEKAPDEVTVAEADFAAAGFGENPVWWAFVAAHENSIVGFSLYYIRFSTWKGCRMYLEDIYIKEAWRGKGIGRLLMSKLIDEAQIKKLAGIVWQVLDWNTTALDFYKKYQVKLDEEWINVTLEIKN